MSAILCIDDDSYLTDLVRYAFTREGYSVLVARRAAEGLALAQKEQPDLVLLEVDLPDGNGLGLCSHLRETLHLPVILVTDRRSDEEILAGFAAGADDYILKPFNVQILLYRARAVMRRRQNEARAPHATTGPVYRLGAITFDPAQNLLLNGATSVRLTRLESRILESLLTHQGQVLTPEQILRRVWGTNADSDISVVKTHIHHLRSKLSAAGARDEIVQTAAGVGYTVPQAPPDEAHKLVG
jgi:DNA-binding response OmpR family regulator